MASSGKERLVINGKHYPLWSQFVERKGEWIGGTLVDTGDDFDRHAMGMKPMETGIVDIVLRKNGDDSAWFEVTGKDFNCGADVTVLGIPASQDDLEWLEFRGYGNHRFKIRRPSMPGNGEAVVDG